MTNLGCRILAFKAVTYSKEKNQEVNILACSFWCTFGKYLNCLNTYNMHTYCLIGIYMYRWSSVPTGFKSTQPGLKIFREEVPVGNTF